MNAHDVAKESYEFWRSVGYNHMQACAWLAMEDGETSFRLGVVGDHGKAFGPFQHQYPRISIIMQPPPKGCGIDVRDPNCTHIEALQAANWETSPGGPPPFYSIRGLLSRTQTPIEAVALLVNKFEMSAHRERDINRRVHLYDYWDNVAKEEYWDNLAGDA
jgi:hypothetical protein